MVTDVTTEPFVPESVKYIRFLVLGTMFQKVLIEPSTEPNVGFYLDDPDTQERSYSGVFPTLLQTDVRSSNINYTPTGLDNQGRPAIIFSGSDYIAQSRVFTVDDASVITGAKGLAFKLAANIGLDTDRLFVVELMNADKRVIGRREITPEEGTTGEFVEVGIDNFYTHSKPEQQGLTVVELTPTLDSEGAFFQTNGEQGDTIYKVFIPAGHVLNLTMFIQNPSITNQSGSVIAYGEDGRIHGRYDIHPDVPYANTLPIFPTDKTLYLVTIGGVFNQSGRTHSRDFIFYSYGQLADQATVSLQLVPVVDFQDMTPPAGSQTSARGEWRISEHPQFSVIEDGVALRRSATIIWSKFHLATDCDKLVVSSLDFTDPDIADTMIVLFDATGDVVREQDGGYALSYDDPSGSMEATLTYNKLAAGTYYFATFMESGGTRNGQSLDDMDSINYSDVSYGPGFGVYNIGGIELPPDLLLSVEVFPDTNVYVDNSKNGCTLAALSGQKFMLKNNPADPFTRSFKCRFVSLDGGGATVAGDPGFRKRSVQQGEVQDSIDPAPVVLPSKGDWIDVVYDDKAEAFQVAGVGHGEFTSGPWVGTVQFSGSGGSAEPIGPSSSITVYPIGWFSTKIYNAGFADGTRFNRNSSSFSSSGNSGEKRYEVSMTVQVQVNAPEVSGTIDDLDTDRTIRVGLLLEGYPFVKNPLTLKAPAATPSRATIADGQVYADNEFGLTLSGNCFVTTLDEVWAFEVSNPYADRSILLTSATLVIREVPLQTESPAPAFY